MCKNILSNILLVKRRMINMGKNRLKKKLEKNFQVGRQGTVYGQQKEDELDKILDDLESVQEAIRIQIDTYKDPRVRAALESVSYMIEEVTSNYYEEDESDTNDWDIITNRDHKNKDDVLTLLERVQDRIAGRNYRDEY